MCASSHASAVSLAIFVDQRWSENVSPTDKSTVYNSQQSNFPGVSCLKALVEVCEPWLVC